MRLKFHMIITYVYLDQNERAKFAEGQFELLIPQHQEMKTITTGGPTSVLTVASTNPIVDIDLNFNHCVSELLWVVRSGIHEAFKATDPAWDCANDWFNFSGPQDVVTGLPIDPVVTASLTFNNAARWANFEGRVFRLLEPFQSHTNIPCSFVYSYAFSLAPQDMQPSGSVNMSRMDSIRLKLTLDRRLFFGPSGENCNDSNNAATIFVFAVNWNVLRFKYGLGGLRFA